MKQPNRRFMALKAIERVAPTLRREAYRRAADLLANRVLEKGRDDVGAVTETELLTALTDALSEILREGVLPLAEAARDEGASDEEIIGCLLPGLRGATN